MLTSEQIRVVRAIRRWSAHQRAKKASICLASKQRMECAGGSVGGAVQILAKVQNAPKDVEVERTAQNGGPIVRLNDWDGGA